MDIEGTPRLMERIDRLSMPVTESGCIVWTGSGNNKGYGQIRVNRKKMVAHRLMYELTFGAIPDGMQLDHLCRVRCCINPHHLEPVTCRENIMRGNGVAATHSRKTHCKNGHPLDGQNLVICKGRYRNCRVCLNNSKLRSSRRINGVKNPRRGAWEQKELPR